VRTRDSGMARPAALAAIFWMAMLSGCSGDRNEAPAAPGAAAESSPVAAANAEFARLQAQGPDSTAREFTKLEYPLTRSLMRAAGIDEALGGAGKADVALTALFMDYERKARALQLELPKAFAPATEGGGGSMGAEGWGGAAASSVLGGSQAATAAQAWENGVDRGESSGHAEANMLGGDQVSVDWTPDSATMTSEVKADVDGLKGKVRTTVKLKTCPDAEGKVVVEFESVSDIAAGSGSANSTVKTTLEVFVDDDANLINDQMESESRAQQSTSSGSSVDASSNISTSRGTADSTVNGLGGGASAEDGNMAQGMTQMGRYAAYSALLLGAQKAWQSGKCVDLQVRSDPAKRKGARPNTAYTLFAEPRAKSDGRPTGGTVRATLNGGNRLNPTGKVKADAKFDYANPEKKDQSATIDFEARSKRGVGKATLEFDTKPKKSYSIEFAQCPGGGRERMRACDVTKPFTVEACGGMATVSHVPTSDKGGSWTFKFQGAGGFADSGGSYTLSGPEESMTVRYVSGKVCGHAAGRTVCATPKPSSVTWTRIEDCDE